ncbi:uncharacterized protein LOC127718010 [Mytilus californianus]|uniref:uncharacterized protein LOC127718010 n=1 Tax=Mytilus californianus TaxID=6549 RepID=UPI00224516A8|nr:uncharacterized protein LOC127718010 [Mytilus californianus]
MADKDNKNSSEDGKSLEDFVTEHYQKQKDAGKMDATDEIDDERTNNFFSKALNESRRMNVEIEKSEAKMKKHREEFGNRLSEWQAEHASEVLTPKQAEKFGICEHP